MELIFKNYKYKDYKLNFTIPEDKISGIIGTNIDDLIDIIKLKYQFEGKIIIDKKELIKKDINTYKRKIEVVDDINNNYYRYQSIKDIMQKTMINKGIYPRDVAKKIIDSLRIVGLNKSLQDRNYYSVSTSEKKLIMIAVALLSNPDMIILKNPFRSLDLKNIKKLFLMLGKIKEQYKKTIVIVSDNVEEIFRYTENLIIFGSSGIIKEGNTYETFKDVAFLRKHKIKLPQIIEFVYNIKKVKKINLEYHRDIRDIIKDIYKHV